MVKERPQNDALAASEVRAPALAAVDGLVHGFGRRAHGDRHERPEQTGARVAKTLAAHGRLLLLRQVHGTVVLAAPWQGLPEGDAATADRQGLLVGVKTADCLPVLIVDPRRRAVAAIHAGWRGSAAGIVRCAVDALRRAGSRPPDLLAALGPGIGPCCYEVGDDVRSAFGPAGLDCLAPGARGRWQLDVRAANRKQLTEAGLDPTHLHDIEECTCCQPRRYYSYRREGPATGRMISYVGWSAGDGGGR